MIEVPLTQAFFIYLSFGVLIFFGYLRDFYRYFRPKKGAEKPGYAAIVRDFEDFFTRRMYNRVRDCWDRPVLTCPGSWIEVVDRVIKNPNKPPIPTGKTYKAVNVGSYNYLGFGDPDSPTRPAVLAALDKYGVACCSPRAGTGTNDLHRELEALVARFVGKPDAICFAMGFGTNAGALPALVGKGGLIISDTMNHASIVIGSRSSGANIRVFKHNDPADLEAVIRRAIVEGQPRTHRPWTKILIVIEGIYSMEGEVPPLAAFVRIKNKYKCYLYVDEAHSIGALGAKGRGICEHAGVDPKDVDILMGTFTKAFGGVGGYIAGDRDLIEWVRRTSYGLFYSAPMSPPATQQAISALGIIMGEDGTNIGQTKLLALRKNANYFRMRLMEMGAHVIGDWDSPIAPVIFGMPALVGYFSRECLRRKVAVVVVGYPATPLLLSRSRFCISAAHTKEDLDFALEVIGSTLRDTGRLTQRKGKVDLPAGLLIHDC